jgi:hypothetical protein
MTQIKEGPVIRCSPEGRGVPSGSPAADSGDLRRLIRSLLERRAELANALSAVDLELVELGRRLGGFGDPSSSAEALGRLALRGDGVVAGRYGVPSVLDREDLERRLSNIRQVEAREGVGAHGLELLVRYQRASGRVVAIDVRRSGEPSWQRRFEAPGPGLPE